MTSNTFLERSRRTRARASTALTSVSGSEVEAGVLWTWERRAQAVGLASAEEAAEKFQAMLAKPAKSCLIEAKAEKSASAGR